MSETSLPDEIISEILSPALRVPDEKFSDISDISPFAEYAESPSAYLLVCKSWLRVATPLLYSVVIIRSKGQAKALGRVLSRNKELGQWIRRLRVEGGCGTSMRTILQAAPNITDLYLSLEIFASDNTAGLCDGLSLIQPKQLILKDSPFRPMHNKMVSRLVDAIAAAIPQWKRLTVFRCQDIDYLDDRGGIVSALAAAKKLQEITVQHLSSAIDAFSYFPDCPLRSIQVLDAVRPRTLEALGWHARAPSLQKIVQFTRTDDVKGLTPDSEVPVATSSPILPFSSTPMSSEPLEVQDKIWSRILYFLLAIPPPTEDRKQRKKRSPRLPLLLVSKMFNRLGLSHYYTHVALDYSDAALHLSLVLSKNPSLGQHVRTLGGGSMSDAYYVENESDDEAEHDANTRIRDIMSQLTGLTEVYEHYADMTGHRSVIKLFEGSISWDAFVAVAQSSGHTLQELSIPIRDPRNRASPMVFAQLVQLRTLAWTSRADFAYIPEQVPPTALSNLTELRVFTGRPSFLEVLSLMELPSLRRVMVDHTDPEFWTFLGAHGAKLTELDLSYFRLDSLEVPILDVCPNLRNLAFFTWDSHIEGSMLTLDHLLSGSNTAPSLEKIKFEVRYRQKHAENVWSELINALESESTRFPQLCEVQFPSCEWPKTERDISKSH